MLTFDDKNPNYDKILTSCSGLWVIATLFGDRDVGLADGAQQQCLTQWEGGNVKLFSA